ncbi:MAG: shikimate kinase [Candidatus Methylarchaceae archaeon HK01M]|nr:shikimate kinase [Candidatus Methylarchaceae archaeon HK01M]
MKGKGLAFGAVSIVNAISTGNGAALGVRLKTEAEVELVEGSKEIQIKVIGSDCEEDKTLARHTIKEVLEYFGYSNYGAKVTTKSEIPIGKGLKSSSVASNAIVLATVSSLRKELDDLTNVNLGVDASIKAGVTITGAFDDACASYFGGLVVTDNEKRIIERREVLVNDYKIVIYVPSEKAYTKDVDKIKLQNLKSLFKEAYLLTIRGRYWDAMVLNGLLCSTALGFSTEPMMSALSAGSIGAGLSGTGPAITAVCPSERVDDIISNWSSLPGEIISTEINNERARMVLD